MPHHFGEEIQLKISAWLVVGTLLVSAIASAQQANLYDGSWNMVTTNMKGNKRTGEVIIKDQGGVWKLDSSPKNDPCVGIRSPIVVHRASTDELVFEIRKSEALSGCRDHMATMKRIDETSLQGATDDGKPLTMNRK